MAWLRYRNRDGRRNGETSAGAYSALGGPPASGAASPGMPHREIITGRGARAAGPGRDGARRRGTRRRPSSAHEGCVIRGRSVLADGALPDLSDATRTVASLHAVPARSDTARRRSRESRTESDVPPPRIGRPRCASPRRRGYRWCEARAYRRHAEGPLPGAHRHDSCIIFIMHQTSGLPSVAGAA